MIVCSGDEGKVSSIDTRGWAVTTVSLEPGTVVGSLVAPAGAEAWCVDDRGTLSLWRRRDGWTRVDQIPVHGTPSPGCIARHERRAWVGCEDGTVAGYDLR